MPTTRYYEHLPEEPGKYTIPEALKQDTTPEGAITRAAHVAICLAEISPGHDDHSIRAAALGEGVTFLDVIDRINAVRGAFNKIASE